MDENRIIMETRFGYTDEFGQSADVKKTFDFESFEDGMTINLLVDEFKLFLLGAGFMPEQVDKIQFVED